MKKFIKNDDGSIKLCTLNIAQMNIIEYMYYNRDLIWKSVIEISIQIKECIDNIFIILFHLILLIFLPITFPIIAIVVIRQSKNKIEESIR